MKEKIAETIKHIENTGEPYFTPLVLCNKLGMNKLEKEFKQPEIEGGLARNMFGIDIIIVDTDFLGLFKPYIKMYRLFGNPIERRGDIGGCKMDFLEYANLEAKKEFCT